MQIVLLVSLCCLCAVVDGKEQVPSKGFLFLLKRIDDLRDEVKSIEKVQKDVKEGLSKNRCQSGKVTFRTPFHRKTIAFYRAFDRTPAVSVGIVRLDTQKSKNARVNCYKSSVRTTSFQIYCSTYTNSGIYGVDISWIAC